jgi:hypothetical protein
MIAFGEFGRDHEDGGEGQVPKKNEPDHHKLHHFRECFDQTTFKRGPRKSIFRPYHQPRADKKEHYNPHMDNDHRFRNELLQKYETGVWLLLILAAAAFLGLIVWMGYSILL